MLKTNIRCLHFSFYLTMSKNKKFHHKKEPGSPSYLTDFKKQLQCVGERVIWEVIFLVNS